MPKEVLNEQVDVIENKIHNLSPALLKILLKDNSTKENLRWATNTYAKYGEWYLPERHMNPELLIGPNINLLTPRVSKTQEEQQARTKDKGEVFTPAWMCNKQINFIDEDWFGRKNVFNHEMDDGWKTNEDKIVFSKESAKTWQDYVTDIRMEITCGEAPYLVSRYDVVKGEIIPVQNRIGILDRKLRVINENVNDETEWLEWTEKAYKSTYGYDYQGDNVLIARENLLYTLIDNYRYKFNKQSSVKIMQDFAKIISWNLWQMDGLTHVCPYSETQKENVQISLIDWGDSNSEEETEQIKSIIKSWHKNKTIKFNEIFGGNVMKFNYIVGNPPYQIETASKSEVNGQTPSKNIFHLFQIEADKLSAKGSVLIYPGGRWIHRSGKGLQQFGYNQINDKKLKKLIYIPNSQQVFGNGVVVEDGLSIVIKSKDKDTDGFEYEFIDNGKKAYAFIEKPNDKLIPLDPRDYLIVKKIDKYIVSNKLKTLNDVMLPRSLFGIESDYVEKNPDKVTELRKNQNIDYKTKIKIFTNDKAGKAGRAKWYITDLKNITVNADKINKWKVVVSSAKPGGHNGRSNQLEIMDNHSVFGRSRIALSLFDDEKLAIKFYKYCDSKFVRFCLLMTDDSLTSVGKYVPIFDINNNNINFDSDISKQMYENIGFNNDEINYIETYVKQHVNYGDSNE